MRSIGARFALTLVLTSTAVGVVGFLAGQSALVRVGALADDQEVETALEDGRMALRDWSKLRQAGAAARLAACAAEAEPERCAVDKATIRPSPVPVQQPRWQDEQTYDFRAADGRAFRAVFAWPALKPQFDKLSDVLARREHLAQLLPELLASFLATFALALLGAAVLGLAATWLLSRRVMRRVRALIAYTRAIGDGASTPAPAATRGKDEVGLLAQALERMALDLEATRRRLILTEKMQSWQQVARKVAHEIKNPLTPISLVAAELTRRGEGGGGEDRGFLAEAGRVLYEECTSLQRMVHEFTAFARLPQPQIAAGDVWETVKDFAQRNAAPGGPQLVLGPAAPCEVPHDAAMIAQVLHNLVNNAARAKLPGVVTVRFAAERRHGALAITVSDDAGGVPEGLRGNLFDAYVTSRSTGESEKGMGLGLAIARKILVDHGGALDLAATGPAGSTFVLSFPLADGSAAP